MARQGSEPGRRAWEVQTTGFASELGVGFEREEGRVTPSVWLRHKGMESLLILEGPGLGNVVQNS